MYCIVAAIDIVLPGSLSNIERLISESLNLRLVSMNRVFILYVREMVF